MTADRAELRRYLLSFRWEQRDAAAEEALVDGGLGLWQRILDVVPPASGAARALEIGSPPFHITLLLRRLHRYDLTLTAFAGDGREVLTQELASPEYGEQLRVACRCFDVERDPFPYPDASFDLVLFCEVLEHLVANPIHALAEMHRVLAPGGVLVVSTPNVARADNLAALLRGDNVYDPYHLGAPLAGSRHSREYTAGELGELLSGCGFALERLEDHDVGVHRTRSARLVAPLARLASRVTGARHGEHLFARARKTSAPFRWHFSPRLFDAAHLTFHRAPRDACVVMGENDVPHLGWGWDAPAPGPDGAPCRRCVAGEVTLVPAADGAPALALAVSSGTGEVQAFQDGTMLVWEPFTAPLGAWATLRFELGPALRPAAPVQVRVVAADGVLVRRVAIGD